MNILFIHQNFPAQFKHLAPALHQAEHQVIAICQRKVSTPFDFPVIQYTPKRGNTEALKGALQEFETKLIRGEAVLGVMHELKQKGFVPDVVVAHPGWGEAMFVKDVWPTSAMLAYHEFYYAAEGVDIGFDPEFHRENPFEGPRLRMKNLHLLMGMQAMDRGLSPTYWQASTIPSNYRERTEVIFDGIDTTVVKPDTEAYLQLNGNGIAPQTFTAADEIITFVSRNLEPYRGYHIFMRTLPAILQARPNAKVLIVGGNGVSYGAKAPEGKSWADIFLNEVKDQLPMDRVFFLGNVPYLDYLRVLQISSCHVYLTYPFVLSWSCFEAMSAGCTVVGSKTPPVEELITHGMNGYLVDFFDQKALVDQVVQVLADKAGAKRIGEKARQTIVEKYDLYSVCLPKQMHLVTEMASHPNR